MAAVRPDRARRCRVRPLRGVGQWRWSAKTRGLLDGLEAARADAAAERFDPGELAGLPAPVARHLRQVLPAGAPIIRAVDAVHRGRFNVSQTGEKWRPFTSRQRVVTRRPGFVWDGRVAMAPGLDVRVHDAYVAGEGILEPTIAGLVTLAHLRDRGEMARGELMRYMGEAAWYPTALLPSQGVRWAPIDADRARAALVDGDIRLSMVFHFGADGLLDTIRAEDRGRAVGNQVVPTPWEVRLSNYQRRESLLIPVDGEVAWLTPEGRLPYWRGTITGIRYERLDPAVGRTRAGRHRPRWQGAKRSSGSCHCEHSQRCQRGPGRLDRVRSELTRQVSSPVAIFVNHIKTLHAEKSGQLPGPARWSRSSSTSPP